MFFAISGFSQGGVSCGISISPVVSSVCNGNFSVSVSIESSVAGGLDGAIFYLQAPDGLNSELEDFTLENNSIILSESGDYLFSLTTPLSLSNECSIPEVLFSIPETTNLSLDFSISDPLCPGADGFFSGTLDGPSGIYNIYFDGEFAENV